MTKLSDFFLTTLFFGLILVGAFNFIGFNALLTDVTPGSSVSINRTLAIIEESQELIGDINETTADEGTVFVFRGVLTSVKRFLDIGSIFTGVLADISQTIGVPEEYQTIFAVIIAGLVIIGILAALLRWNL